MYAGQCHTPCAVNITCVATIAREFAVDDVQCAHYDDPAIANFFIANENSDASAGYVGYIKG